MADLGENSAKGPPVVAHINGGDFGPSGPFGQTLPYGMEPPTSR